MDGCTGEWRIIIAPVREQPSLQSEHVDGQMCTPNFSGLNSPVQHDGCSASSETPTEGHCTQRQDREGVRVWRVYIHACPPGTMISDGRFW